MIGSSVWLVPEVALSGTTAPVSARPTVAVVGDSITELSRQSIETSLVHAGYQPSVDAVVGIQIAQAEPFVYQLAQQRPSDWIIELGTNDAGKDNPSWEWPLVSEWQQIQSSRCVVYLTVSPRVGAIADQINDALARLALGHANVHILDWGYLEYGNPAWLEPDLIHPTPSGQAELATLETQEIRRYC